MSKVAMPRPRYVAFRIESPDGAAIAAPLAARTFSRAAMARGLAQACRAHGWEGPEAHLTRYDFPHGIVRVEHQQLPALRTVLATVRDMADGGATPIRLCTLSTSGTLAALTGRTRVLVSRGERLK